MSFNRLDYDTCAYKQHISESIGPVRISISYSSH